MLIGYIMLMTFVIAQSGFYQYRFFPLKRCKATISSLSYDANCIIIAIIRQIAN